MGIKDLFEWQSSRVAGYKVKLELEEAKKEKDLVQIEILKRFLQYEEAILEKLRQSC